MDAATSHGIAYFIGPQYSIRLAAIYFGGNGSMANAKAEQGTLILMGRAQ